MRRRFKHAAEISHLLARMRKPQQDVCITGPTREGVIAGSLSVQ